MGARESALLDCNSLGLAVVILRSSMAGELDAQLLDIFNHNSAGRSRLSALQSCDGEPTEHGTLEIWHGDMLLECTLEPRAGLADHERWTARRACWRQSIHRIIAPELRWRSGSLRARVVLSAQTTRTTVHARRPGPVLLQVQL